MNRIISFILCIVLCSCGSYSFVEKKNPLANYNVSSVSIPMFLNRSVFSGLSGPVTQEIYLKLASYPEIKVYSGANSTTQAVLVGILYSKEKLKDVFTPEESYLPRDVEAALGTRMGFYAPSTINYELVLRVILVKRNPKKIGTVLFDEEIAIARNYSTIISPNTGVDSSGPVNFTKNRGLLNSDFKLLARDLAKMFEEEILGVF